MLINLHSAIFQRREGRGGMGNSVIVVAHWISLTGNCYSSGSFVFLKGPVDGLLLQCRISTEKGCYWQNIYHYLHINMICICIHIRMLVLL